VRQALDQAEPPARKSRARTAPRLNAFKAAIDEMLRQNLNAPRKQRHTARRVFARFAEEHDATDLSYSTVRDYVRRRRPEIDLEAGRVSEVFVPQEHAPDAEAEVDFGEVWVVLGGVKTKCHMFAFWLSHPGKAIHRIYPTQARKAFLEGHIDAFNDMASALSIRVAPIVRPSGCRSSPDSMRTPNALPLGPISVKAYLDDAGTLPSRRQAPIRRGAKIADAWSRTIAATRSAPSFA